MGPATDPCPRLIGHGTRPSAGLAGSHEHQDVHNSSKIKFFTSFLFDSQAACPSKRARGTPGLWRSNDFVRLLLLSGLEVPVDERCGCAESHNSIVMIDCNEHVAAPGPLLLL